MSKEENSSSQIISPEDIKQLQTLATKLEETVQSSKTNEISYKEDVIANFSKIKEIFQKFEKLGTPMSLTDLEFNTPLHYHLFNNELDTIGSILLDFGQKGRCR